MQADEYDYEIASGRFDKTVDPALTHFRDLPQKLEGKWMNEHRMGKGRGEKS